MYVGVGGALQTDGISRGRGAGRNKGEQTKSEVKWLAASKTRLVRTHVWLRLVLDHSNQC